MSGEARIRKLRWMCRRGMKELDVLLESFLETKQAELRAGAWPELERLLETEDDQLWDWLRGAASPPDDSFAPLVEAITQARVARTGSENR